MADGINLGRAAAVAVGFSQGGGLSLALQLAGGVGLVLWIWLWGELGTILAVPMLAVMKAVADHVDALKPLGRLMAR